MSDVIFKTIYLLGLLAEIVIRAPFNRLRRRNKIVTDQVNRQEKVLLLLLFLGGFVLPVIYIFTPWLNFANYALPVWAQWLGVVILLAGLWVFWKAHQDLGRNWSPSLQIREGHTLTTTGLYHYIRHPMLASHW